MITCSAPPLFRRPMVPVLGETSRLLITTPCRRQHVVDHGSSRTLSVCSTSSSRQHDSRLLSYRTTSIVGQSSLRLHRCLRLQSTQQETVTTSIDEAAAPAPPPADPPAESALAAAAADVPKAAPGRIQKTMAGLDALLGIVDEPPTTKDSTNNVTVGVSAEALRKLAEAEASRLSPDGSQAGPIQDKLEGQMQKIIERARKLAESNEGSKGPTDGDQRQLRTDFENLLRTLSNKEAVSKEDIKKLRESVFGPMTFWVTETVPLLETDRVGVTIRGNLRDDRTKVFELLCKKLEELFPGKYEALMVEDLELDGEEGGEAASTAASKAAAAGVAAGPRVAFQIIPAAQAIPPQQTGWKAVIALLTTVFLVAACVQLALVANISKLPKETLEYFANPDAFPRVPDGALPPGLENWDAEAYFATAVPVATLILGVNAVHELGHRIAAYVRKVKLGPSFFIPNLDIGSFGAITPFASLLKGRGDLWDVAAAGPLGGMMMSASLLGLGLLQSHSDVAKDLLVTIPSSLFQGSLLLGTVTRMVLGDDALRGAEVTVSPLLVAGWCGVVVNSLQLLPVGSLDGGRLVQAAFGKQVLALTSFFTYLGLGLGLLASNLSLPFGLYVIICQREAEAFIKDSVSPIGETRQTATLVAVLTALLVLLPMAPELAESFGVGTSNPFL